MRTFLTYLMLLGALAGLTVSAFGNPGHRNEEPVCLNCVEHPSDHDCEGANSDSSGEKHCPQCPDEPHEHHRHTGSCCTPGFLIIVDFSMIRLAPLVKRHELFTGVEDIIPDSPVLSEDKPPLI